MQAQNISLKIEDLGNKLKPELIRSFLPHMIIIFGTITAKLSLNEATMEK